jgi:hypothetical protein
MKNIIYLLLLLSTLLALPGSASLVLKNLTINEEPLVNVSIPLFGLFFFNSVKKELISYFPTEKEVPGYLPPTPSDVTLLCRLKGSDSREFVISDDTMDIPKNIASCDAKIKISNVPSDTAVLPWLRIEFMRGVSHFLEAGLLAQATRLFSKVSALEFFGSREFGLQSRDAWARNLPKYVCKMYDNLVESKEHEDTYPIYDWSLFTESELDIASKSCRPNIDKLLSKIVDGIKQKKYNEIAVIWRNVLNFKLLSKSSVAAQKEIFRALFGSYREDLQQLLFSEKYDEAGELWAVIKNLGLFTEQDDKATLESLMPWVSAQVEKASHYLTTGQYENFNNINKIKKAVSFLWDRLAPRIQEQYDRWVKDNLAPVDNFMRERNFGAAQKALINTEAAIKATEDSHFYDYIKINKIKESFVNFPVFPSEIKRRVIKYLYSQIETNLEQNRMTEAARWLKVFTSGEYRGMGLDQQDLRSAYAKFAFRIIPEESSISLKVPGKFLAARIAVHFARKTKDNPNPYVERFNLQIPAGATVRELKEALLGHYRKYPNVYFHQKEPRLENFLIDYEDDKYAPVDWYETINGHLVYESKIYYVAPPSSRKTVDSVLEQIIDLYEAGKIEEAAHRYAEEKSNPVFDRRSRYSIISGFEIIENIFGAKAIEQLTALLHTLEGNTSSATEPITAHP